MLLELTYMYDHDLQAKFGEDHRYDQHCPPCYQFNWGERVGNAWITPIHNMIQGYHMCSSNWNCVQKVAYIVASFVIALLSLPGFVFKRLGECVNVNGGLRKEAIRVIISIDKDPNSAAWRAALDPTVGTLGAAGNARSLENWERLWRDFRRTLARGEDPAAAEAAIRAAVPKDNHALKGFVERDIAAFKQIEPQRKALAARCAEYNTLLDRMVANLHLAVPARA